MLHLLRKLLFDVIGVVIGFNGIFVAFILIIAGVRDDILVPEPMA